MVKHHHSAVMKESISFVFAPVLSALTIVLVALNLGNNREKLIKRNNED
jgi:hypothetical protein